MLVRMRKKGSPHTLLVGMQIGVATVESRIKLLQKKSEMKLPYAPEIPLLGRYPKKFETLIGKNI